MAASKIRIKKICEYCGQEFYALKTSTRFCSKLCNDRAYKMRQRVNTVKKAKLDLITITQEYDLKFIAEKIMYGQFLEDGYPVDRGTCIKLSSRNALLWTHGVVPSIQSNRRYYQGGRCIPAPLKITKYYGHGDLETIAKEILGFTKMNWNSFNLYTKLPATIDTSNTLAQVGNLLRQYNGVTYDYRFFI